MSDSRYEFPIDGACAILRLETSGEDARRVGWEEVEARVAAWRALLVLVGGLFEAYGWRALDATKQFGWSTDSPCVWRFAKRPADRWILVFVSELGEVAVREEVGREHHEVHAALQISWDRRDRTLVGRPLGSRLLALPGAPPVFTSPVEELVRTLRLALSSEVEPVSLPWDP